MPDPNPALETALRQIRYLSETIGGRGSCTPSVERAAEYLASEMRSLGLQEVRLERFRGAPSTYRPYALAFIAALLGTLLVWLVPQASGLYALAALLNALGAWGMLAETDFNPNWMRLLLPSRESQNAIGVIAPQEVVRQHVVLSAHIDTHRTPVFYSSKTWQMLFSVLVGGAFASMVLSALLYSLGGLLSWYGVRWIGLVAAAMEVFALVMVLHADLTPFSPGANDDASGIGVTMAIVERLSAQPLQFTQVWLAFTDCEEAASYGMFGFIRAHRDELGEDAVYVVNDQVGAGYLSYILSDGLILKHPVHPVALALARRTRDELLGEDEQPQVNVTENHGAAYTDATLATKLGYRAITLVANPPPGSSASTHWHQMSDTIENIDPDTLKDAFIFTWQLLQVIDRKAADIDEPIILEENGIQA